MAYVITDTCTKDELCVEELPVFRIERGNLLAGQLSAVKQEILDKVRRQQRRPTRVQRFKDQLRIVFLVEVDDNQANVFPRRIK